MSKSRRILLLITDLQIGGTPTVVRELATRLHRPPKVRVDVACLAGPGPVVDQLRSAGIEVTPLGAKRPTDLRVFKRLKRLIVDNEYDTVFSFLIHANTAAALVAPFTNGVTFVQSIQTTQPKPRWHWQVQRLITHLAGAVVVPSPSVATVAKEWAHVPDDKIALIPNAIDMPNRSKSAKPAAREAGKTHIGFIGRLDPVKRIPDLLEALLLLKNPVHLHIFGEGSQRAKIQSLIKKLNVSDRVTLHGAIARPDVALEQIALLVLPSEAEGFGLVLIEAMAAGVPVVATDAPGIRDVVKNEQTGLLVPIASPPKLAEAIDRVVSDAALRRKLIAAAETDVRKRFTWDSTLPLYRTLLKLS